MRKAINKVETGLREKPTGEDVAEERSFE